LIDRELTPATAALRREIETRFHSALDQLDEEPREIIIMRHFEQLSNQEVATALGLSEAAASMRYLRAVRRLREVLLPGDPSAGVSR
jgi:RNA polymerase sigma-70 factor (ECF subfamily)